jgi:hypothetical protein
MHPVPVHCSPQLPILSREKFLISELHIGVQETDPPVSQCRVEEVVTCVMRRAEYCAGVH